MTASEKSEIEQLRAELAELREQIAIRDDQYRIIVLCMDTVSREVDAVRAKEAVKLALDEFNRRWPAKE